VTAKDPPATSSAGQTSHTRRHDPPSIFTCTAVIQTGTMSEKKGNCRAAIFEISSALIPVTISSAEIGVPSAP
jgi:hypothetical protein